MNRLIFSAWVSFCLVSGFSCGAFADQWLGSVSTDFNNGANYDSGTAPSAATVIDWRWAFGTSSNKACLINGGTANSSDINAYTDTPGTTTSFTVTYGAVYNIGNGQGWLQMGSQVNNAPAVFTVNGGATVNLGYVECGRVINGGSSLMTINIDGPGSCLNVNQYMWIARSSEPGPACLNVTNGATVNFNTVGGLRLNDAGTNDGVVNVTGGFINIQGNSDFQVPGWVSNHWLIANNGSGTIKHMYDAGNDITRIWSDPTQTPNLVLISWGDQIITNGPGTDAALDSPQSIDAAMARFKGRGFTAVGWRSDITDGPPGFYCLNDVNPVTALICNRIKDLTSSISLLQYARQSAEAHGLEFWVWATVVYSEGSPQTYPTMYDGVYPGPFTGENSYIRQHPEVITIDRNGNEYYGVREYGYPDARADKVQELVWYAQHWGVKNIIACMRTEAAQFQPPPDKPDRFGFNQPVVDAMLAQYGINIMTDPDFDVDSPTFSTTNSKVQLWHTLRGAYLTQFYRDLRAGLNAVNPNVRVGVLVPGGDYIGPDLGNWQLDWRTWVNEGLVYQFILPQYLDGTGSEDPLLATKPYLTDMINNKGIYDISVFRSYADSSAHPETRFLSTGSDQHHRTVPPAGCGWRTWWMEDGFDLGWSQRWKQWKKDILDFGYIKFFDQNFDGFPVYNAGSSTGIGNYQYDPKLRACPGLWWPFGDGTTGSATVQSDIHHGDSGNAVKLTAANDFYVRHLTIDSRELWSIDQALMNGTCTFDFWIYRSDATSAMTVYMTQDGVTANGFGLYLLNSASPVRYRKYQNGSYVWSSPSPVAPLSVGAWQKFSIQVNVDAKTYSAYTGNNNETLICTNIPYSPAVNYLNILYFSPQGSPGDVIYLDDVSVHWVPTLYYTPKGKNTYLSDDFESHTEYQTAHNTSPVIGGAWQVNPSTQQSRFFIERDLSYGDGWKCLTAPLLSDGSTISNGGPKLVLAAGNIVTMDLDVYVESNKSAVFGLAKTSSGPDVVSIQLTPSDTANSKIKCWSGSSYVDSGKTLVDGIWYHFQAALDCSAGTYKVVAQQSGSMPFVVGTYNWGTQTQSGDGVLFKIGCMGTLSGTYPYIYYDNIEVHYGLPNECGDEAHPYPQGDFNSDCHVNYLDLSTLIQNWLGSNPQADMDNSGTVDFADFAKFASYWLACTSQCN